jgi:hypothetical protein
MEMGLNHAEKRNFMLAVLIISSHESCNHKLSIVLQVIIIYILI